MSWHSADALGLLTGGKGMTIQEVVLQWDFFAVNLCLVKKMEGRKVKHTQR